MSNRIRLSASYGARAARAGVNVETASGLDLLFDSDRLSIPKFASFTGRLGSSDSVVNYGKTFSGIPLISIMMSIDDPSGQALSAMRITAATCLKPLTWLAIPTRRNINYDIAWLEITGTSSSVTMHQNRSAALDLDPVHWYYNVIVYDWWS